MTIKDDILMDIARDVVAQIQHEIVADDLVYQHRLFDSWEITKEDNGDIIIGSPLVYAQIMDEGRLPGSMPPVDALFPWVRDKFKDVHSNTEARRVAFAVAQKIAKEGIEPRHYIKRALFAMEKGSQ